MFPDVYEFLKALDKQMKEFFEEMHKQEKEFAASLVPHGVHKNQHKNQPNFFFGKPVPHQEHHKEHHQEHHQEHHHHHNNYWSHFKLF